MKKITFVLFALIAGTTFAQNSANAAATVLADIVNPITISSTGALNFGKIASKGTIEYVVLSPDNVRTIPEDMKIPGDQTTSVPTFTVTKAKGITYKVVTGSKDLTFTVGTGDTAVTETILLGNITTSLDANAAQIADNFTVGGTLTISAGQPSGLYEGEVSVTVSYE